LVAQVPVSHVPFDAADGYGGIFLSQCADCLALSLLRADPAADGGERVLALQYPYCLRHVALAHRLDELWYIHVHRAAAHAHALGTLDAARGLFLDHFI